MNAYKVYAARNNMYDFYDIRDEMMYENFIKVYSRLPKGKYYGQFGLGHIFQGLQDNINWLASLMNSSDSPVKDKVLSIAYTYKDCRYMNSTNKGYSEANLTDYLPCDDLLNPYTESDLVLFRLLGRGSPFEKSIKWYGAGVKPTKGVTTDYYQFILFIKGSKATTPLGE